MNSKYFKEDKWWVSPYNFVDEVTAKFDLPQKVEIHDATLKRWGADTRRRVQKG